MMDPGAINQNSGNYSFASQPQAVRSGSGRKKFREPTVGPDGRMAINIMWDRRVVRGNTYAAQVLPAAVLQATSPGRSTAGSALGSARPPQFSSGRMRGDKSSTALSEAPEPVVECLLEEITDRPIEIDTIVSNQKIQRLDRPPSPMFVPQPRGIDVATQVQDSDLFNFDVEVEPMLQVIVGTTLEKALAELTDEDNLFEELQAREVFELVRMSERIECERVELAEVRKQEERERRIVNNLKREADAKEELKRYHKFFRCNISCIIECVCLSVCLSVCLVACVQRVSVHPC